MTEIPEGQRPTDVESSNGTTEDRSLPPGRSGSGGSPLQSGRRQAMLVIGLIVLVLMGLVGLREFRQWQQLHNVPDYSGSGGAELIVRIEEGDTLSAIGDTLFDRGVVASVRAFTRAAEAEPRIKAVQPGYYQMRIRMSGAAAVARLLDPAAQVGQLEIRGGQQLDDVSLPDGTTVPGVLTELSRAGCARIGDVDTCVGPEELRIAMGQADPLELGLPNWIADPLARVEPGRRLEGLLLPGKYSVLPGSPPQALLAQATETSMARLLETGLPGSAAGTGYSPYEVLVIASIIEREAITSDFGKVSRVIYNRLAEGMPLQMDSTINYPLDRQQVRTSAVDRARSGAYNTYLNRGLPVSPIGAPSAASIAAAAAPEPGPWRYFVKCQRDGTSCFSVSIDEHEAAVSDAVARGVF